jgi:hypothetical protein
MSTSATGKDPLQGVHDAVGTSTLALAILGAFVAFLTGFVPGSPVIGGALVGWLHREDPARGAKIGAFAGLLFALPAVLVASLFFGLFLGVSLFSAIPAAFGIVVLLFFVLSTAYTVGLGALGAYLGTVAYQRRYGATRANTGGGARSRDDQFDDTQF